MVQLPGLERGTGRDRQDWSGKLFLIVAASLLPALSQAADATRHDVAREIGAVLGWRLSPEAVEERCRAADPEGVEARQKLVAVWREKNARLIAEVDARVAEIVPLLSRPSTGGDPVQAIREQVTQLLLEPIFSGRSPEEAATICKTETNPTNTRWTSNGLPHVQQSLAELYDWKISRGGK